NVSIEAVHSGSTTRSRNEPFHTRSTSNVANAPSGSGFNSATVPANTKVAFVRASATSFQRRTPSARPGEGHERTVRRRGQKPPTNGARVGTAAPTEGSRWLSLVFIATPLLGRTGNLDDGQLPPRTR